MNAVEKLTADLRYGNLPERRTALAALAAQGPAAVPALPDLIAALRDSDAEVRERTAAVVLAIGPAAVPVLLAALLPEDVAARRAVVRLLGLMGPDARAAAPVLTAAQQDPQLGGDATWALGQIQGQPLLNVRQRLAQAAPALGVVALAFVVVLVAWLSGADAASAGISLSGRMAAACTVLGAGVGCLLGGSHGGRPGAVAGILVLGAAGGVLGLLAGSLAESILGPLSTALRR